MAHAAEAARQLLNAGSPEPLTEFHWAEVGRFAKDTSQTHSLRRVVTRLRKALEDLDTSSDATLRATTLNNLGNALSLLAERDERELSRAVTVYEEAIKLWERSPERVQQWAATETNLGHVLRQLGRREEADYLPRAVDSYRKAVHRWDDPRYRYLLASVLLERGERDSSIKDIKEAIQGFEEAAATWREDAKAALWLAAADHDRGVALTRLAIHDDFARREGRLKEAVSALEAALERRRRDEVPLAWAESQHRLGNALYELGELLHDGSLLQRAACSFRRALGEQRTAPALLIGLARTYEALQGINRDADLGSAASTLYSQALARPDAAARHSARVGLVRLQHDSERRARDATLAPGDDDPCTLHGPRP
jgi:tetratricopeptide (TPR) repeat protein